MNPLQSKMKQCKAFQLISIRILLSAAIAITSPVIAGEHDFTEQERTVLVHVKSPRVDVYGSGAWISKNRVLTASHLFLGVSADEPLRIDVIRNGVAREARVSRRENPAVLDLALLAIEEIPMEMRTWSVSPVDVCGTPLRPADPVIAAFQLREGKAHELRTYGSPDRTTWLNGVANVTAVTALLPHGASGGAIYDMRRKCLAGVISQQEVLRAEPSSIYITNFVPASEIAAFLMPKDERPFVEAL